MKYCINHHLFLSPQFNDFEMSRSRPWNFISQQILLSQCVGGTQDCNGNKSQKKLFYIKKIILILILMLFRYDLRGATDLNSLSKGDQKKIWSPKLAFTNAKVIGGTKDSDK